MGDLSPAEVEKLILGYEELEPGDREMADQYLARNPQLDSRLKWHQNKEKAARADLPVGGEPWDGNLSPEELAAQEESLRRILSALDEHRRPEKKSNGKVLGFIPSIRRQAAWALPLAAVLALFFLMPRDGQEKGLLQDLSITRIELLDDGSRGPTVPVDDGAVLRTGQAFALDFSLVDDAFVVVYHVSPAGQVSRVFPETITDDLSPHRGGQGHQIPAIDGDEVWILGSETGTETFLLATSADLPRDLDQVQATSGLTDRQTIVDDLKTQLESRADQVEIRTFEHRD